MDARPVLALLNATRCAELLVIGRHDCSSVGSLALGNVARRCLNLADCPVLVTACSGTAQDRPQQAAAVGAGARHGDSHEGDGQV